MFRNVLGVKLSNMKSHHSHYCSVDRALEDKLHHFEQNKQTGTGITKDFLANAGGEK